MTTPTSEQRDAKIRELLLMGNPIDVIVAHGGAIRATRDDVLRVAAANGWTLDQSGRVPRTDRARAGEQLRAAAQQKQAQAAAPPRPTSPPALAVVPTPAPPTEEDAMPPLWTALLTAREHPAASIKRRADRLHEQLQQLAADLEAAEQERQRRERVAKLEQELAAAKAALKGAGTKTTATRSKGEAAQVRAWARENGITVPSYGRVPQAVVEQWRKATS